MREILGLAKAFAFWLCRRLGLYSLVMKIRGLLGGLMIILILASCTLPTEPVATSSGGLTICERLSNGFTTDTTWAPRMSGDSLMLIYEICY